MSKAAPASKPRLDVAGEALLLRARSTCLSWRRQQEGARRRDTDGSLRQRQNSDAAIAKLRFCESRTVKVVTPIKLPRSSNRPPPEEPSETGAVIWMYSASPSDVRSPDNRPLPSVLTRPFGEPIVNTASPTARVL